jgi:catechol 2,3-dioxygenase-like lactoylglutathione lyase family enzyme
MKQSVAMITVLVREYDEALSFYTGKMNFELVEDRLLEDGKRWVVISPKGSERPFILLAKASNSSQLAQVGCQSGDRVFLFLYTDDFWRDYHKMNTNGVHFLEDPRTEAYGTVAVFEDLYGNRWDLLEPAPE